MMRRTGSMTKTIYKQADSRWGSLPYPTKAYSFAHNGCGCCAVTHCAIEQEKYKNLTPADVRKYMVQYATKGHGTLWKGITAGLEHYGYTVHWRQADTMADIFKIIEASPIKRGVILFGSDKGPDGTVWTKSGHYIAFTDYRVKGGKHQFNLSDSGGRNRNYWWEYEKSMRGDVRNVWICTGIKDAPAPAPTPTPKPGTYTGAWPTATIKKGSKGANVERWQRFLKWMGYAIAVDGDFGKKTHSITKKAQKKLGFSGKAVDGIVGPNTLKKAKAYVKKNSEPVAPAQTPSTSPQIVDIRGLSKVVDISYWQSSADLTKAKKDGVDGVIIRTSYTSQSKFELNPDSRFKGHYDNAKKAGLPVGVYHYSQAISEAEAKKEAEYICKQIAGLGVDLPVVMDWEFGGRLSSTSAKKLGKSGCTKVVKAFLDTIKSKGYTPMLYANYSALTSYLDYSALKKSYLIWLAQYNKTASLDYDLWQYTSSGSIAGINGKVDVSRGRSPRQEVTGYSGEMPSLRVKKTPEQTIADALRWGYNITKNDLYHYGEYGHREYKTKDGGKYIPIYNVTHSCGCHFCNTNKKKKVNKANKLGYKGENWEHTYVCNTFISAIYAHGGQDPGLLAKCKKAGAAGMDGKGRSPYLDKAKNWTYLGKIPIKELKAGDVLVSTSHMQCVYAPSKDGKKLKIIEATSYIGTYPSSASNNSIRVKEKSPSYTSVYRYTGTIDKDMNIIYGEFTDRVALWQEFLNWAGYDCGKADRIYGLKTLAATDDFQRKTGLTVDGIVGPKTLEKANEIAKK